MPKLLYWSRDLLFVAGKIQGIVGNSSLLAMIALLGLIVFGVQLRARTVAPRLGASLWMLLAALIAAFTRSGDDLSSAVVVCAVVLAAMLVGPPRARTTPRPTSPTGALAALVLAGAGLVAVFSRQLLALLGKSDTSPAGWASGRR